MAVTQKYLPAKSRVVVQQKGKSAVWYDTQKEVIVVESKSAQCPITNDVNVRVVTVSGVSIWFQPRMIRSRIVLETGDVDETTFNEQFSLFHYDVPSDGESEGYSPCAELYRVAVRLTKSAWLVKTGDVPYDLMGRMQDIGCKVYCNKFDRTETRSLMLQAVEQLQAKMVEATAEAEQSYHRANLQLINSADPDHKDYQPDETKATERFTKRCALIEKRLEELAKDIQTGAGKFGISTKSYGQDQLHIMAKLTKSRSQKQANSYHRATVTLAASTSVDAQALAVVAAQSAVPPMVLVGMLEDIGEETQAGEMNEVFSLVGHGDD